MHLISYGFHHVMYFLSKITIKQNYDVKWKFYTYENTEWQYSSFEKLYFSDCRRLLMIRVKREENNELSYHFTPVVAGKFKIGWRNLLISDAIIFPELRDADFTAPGNSVNGNKRNIF